MGCQESPEGRGARGARYDFSTNTGFFTVAVANADVFFVSVLAIELLAACQGIEFLRPLHTTTPLEKVYELVRSVVK